MRDYGATATDGRRLNEADTIECAKMPLFEQAALDARCDALSLCAMT